MKYQIILESNKQLADDEFDKLVRRHGWLNGFKLVLARSLEGIRPEVYGGCETIKHKKVMEKSEWEKLHKPHLTTLKKFRISQQSKGPDYLIMQIKCPCGKALIYKQDEDNFLDGV